MNVLPFLPEFHAKIRDGSKTMTCRSKPYGHSGDKVLGPGGLVLILEHVVEWPLGEVADDCWQIEGCESREAFIEVWNRIHPRKGFNPATMVWAHRFRVEGRPPVSDAGRALECLESHRGEACPRGNIHGGRWF